MGYLAIGARLSIGNISRGQPNPALESGCPALVQRLIEENSLAIEIVLQLPLQAVKPWVIVGLPSHARQAKGGVVLAGAARP